MNHGQYKANECRINYKITDFPVSFSVARQLAHRLNANLMTYQQATKQLTEYGLEYMVKGHKGFSVATENGGYLIYIDAELDSSEKTKIVLHECGHIYCGHIAVRPLGMPDEIDSTQEAEANQFALFFAAPPYVIHKMKLDNVEKIQEATLLNREDATDILVLSRSDAMHHPTDQELQLWRMMSGKRRLVLPASVGGGVAALAITGVIVWAAVGHTPDTPVIGSPSSVTSDASSSVMSAISDVHSASSEPPVASQNTSNTASVNHTAITSKPATTTKPEQSSSAPGTISSVPDNRPTKAEVTAAYNAKKQSLQAQISDIDGQIEDKNKLLETAETARDDLKKSYDQMVKYSAGEQVLAKVQAQIDDREKEIADLTAELDKLKDDKTRLTQELSKLTDQYMVDLMGAK